MIDERMFIMSRSLNLSFNLTAPTPWSTVKLVTRIGSVGNKPRLGIPKTRKY